MTSCNPWQEIVIKWHAPGPTEKQSTINWQKLTATRFLILLNADLNLAIKGNAVGFYKKAIPIFSASKRYVGPCWLCGNTFMRQLQSAILIFQTWPSKSKYEQQHVFNI